MTSRLITVGVAALCLSAAAFPARCFGTPTVGAPVTSPSAIPVGRSIQLTVTSTITSGPNDPAVIPAGVNLLRVDASGKSLAILGVMHDDGTAGDAVAGDGIFAFRLTASGSAAEPLRLQVSAPFYKVLKRVLSAVTVVPVQTIDSRDVDDDGDGFTENQGDCDDRNPAVHPGAAEICNSIDDNCDGVIDNGFDVGAACTVGVGACSASGTKVCANSGTTTVCNATPGAPQAERCNGIDDDCDGGIDNGFDIGASCTVGLGACTNQGRKVCSPGGATTVCDAVPGTPQVERCNGVDDNCDGIPDDGFDVGSACTVGVGACARTGSKRCTAAGSGTECDATPGTPAPEICGNGIDEDCDGADSPCPSAGPGVITGEVVDDSSGLPILGARIDLVSIDAAAPPHPVSVSTDARGRFRISSGAGVARIHISNPLFTAADRDVEVVAGERTDPRDARLTPLDGATPIASVIGGTVANQKGDVVVTLPPGALPQDEAVRATRVSPQGLIAPLPLGWAVVAAVDLQPADLALGAVGALSLSDPSGFPSTPLTIARWDHVAGAWIAAGLTRSAQVGAGLVADVNETGQYAFLLPDLLPASPPAPVDGAALQGAAGGPLPSNLGGVATAVPSILFAAPDARSRVSVSATGSGPFPSGTDFETTLTEAFDFADGSHLYPEPTNRGLTLYTIPPHANGESTFTVTPSLAIDPLTLRLGSVDVAVRLGTDAGIPRGTVVGSAGGTATTTGARVTVAPNAASEDLPILLSVFTQAEFPAALPPALTFLGGVAVDLHGAQLTRAAQLAIPAPSGLPGGAQVLVAQLTEVNRVSYLAVVAVAVVQGAELVAVTDPRGDGSLLFPGIGGEGRYVFLLAAQPLGFINGTVFGDTGQPQPQVIVSTDTLSLVALTDRNGRYTLAAPLGNVTVSATDPVTKDVAAAAKVLTASSAILSVDLTLASTPPSVVSAAPADGAVDVPLAAVVKVTFSEPIDPSSFDPSIASLVATSGPVAGSASLSPDRETLTFRPDTFLQSQTVYSFTVAAGLRDLAGNPMPSAFTAQFRTVDHTPPPPPQAGQISATIPDASGHTTVSGTQGTADPAGLVLVRNLKTGTLTSFTVNGDGSFSGTVLASPADRLELIIRDAAGNETRVPMGAFRNADGSVVVGSAGGRVDGPGGVFVDIPAAALPDGTVVKVDPLTAADLTLPAPANYPFVGGIRLNLSGVTALQPLDIGIAPPPDAQPTDQVLIARAVQVRGQPAWTVVDRALEEVLGDGIGNEDGTCDAANEVCVNNYRTGSFPFPQIFGGGDFVFLRAEDGCVSWVHMTFDFIFDYVIDATGLGFVFPTGDVHTAVLPAVCGAPLDIHIVNPNTGEVLRSIARRAPARRDEIDEPAGIETDDRVPPIIIETNLFSGYQIAEIEIRFSEPMDQTSLDLGFSVFDSGGSRVGGKVELREGDTLAVFRPDLPFNLGEQHRVKLTQLADRAGNVMPDVELAFMPFDPTGTDPFPLQRLRDVPGLGDALDKCLNGSCTPSTRDVALLGNTLFLANGVLIGGEQYRDPNAPQRLLAVNIDDATDPLHIGFNATGTNPRVLAAVDNVDVPAFGGDLLIVAGGGRTASDLAPKLEFYNATPCTARPIAVGNCLDDSLQALRGSKLLGTVGSGVPQQLAVLHQRAPGNDTVVAYVVTSAIGLQGVDVGRALNANDSTPVGLVRGDFLDVAVLHGLFANLVLGIELDASTNEFGLDVFSPQLTNKLPVSLPGPAARVIAVPNYVVDLDGDGRVLEEERDDNDATTLEDELFDLALVTSGPLFTGCGGTVPCGKLYVVDLSAISGLGHADDRGVIAEIPLPGPAFSLQYDPGARLAYVEVRGQGLAIVDLGNMEEVIKGSRVGLGLVDVDGDGRDDRILDIVPKQDIFAGEIKLDVSRGLTFVNGSVSGLDVLQIANACNELSADFEPQATELDPVVERTRQESPERKLMEEREKLVAILNRAARALIAAGFAADQNGDGQPDNREFSMLEQGSGACFWRTPFPQSCTSFQAGTSDHDIEVYLPQPDVKTAQGVLDAFVDAEEAAGRLDGIGRVTLFAFSKNAFEAAELLNGTPQNRSGDPAGDLAMGRQLLLLLWLLEGEYIPGYEGTLSLDEILAKLKAFPAGPTNPVIPDELSGIPRLEGYEWSLLQELNFYKTGAPLRIAGACDAANRAFGGSSAASDLQRGDASLNFEDADFLLKDCQEQLHTVAKSAIRTVMARLAADDRTNPTLLDIDDRTAYRTNACLTGVNDVRNPLADAGSYTQKPCGSFEEYIASAAVKSVRDQRGLLQPADLPRIFRFYCVKVGKNCANREGKLIGGPYLRTDLEANALIADAIKFIEDAKDETLDAYNRTVALDRKPIGNLPFLTEVSKACTDSGAGAVDATSERRALRDCNKAIVAKKLDGNDTVGVGPPKPVEIVTDKDRRKNLEKRFGVRNLVQRNLQVRGVNEGARHIADAVVSFYDGDGLDQSNYMVEKSVPVDLFPGERRVLDVDATKMPLFPTVFDLTRFDPNQPRAISFFLDPERRVPEGDKEDNAAAFFFYELDRVNPQGPQLAPRVEFPIKDVSPDPLCVAPPAIELEVTARTPADTAPLPSSDVTLTLGQEVVLDYRVRNRRTEDLTGLVVRRDGEAVFNQSQLPGRSATSQDVMVAERFVPSGPGTFFLVVTVTAQDQQGNTVASNTARVKVTVLRPPCDALITTLPADPNPADKRGLAMSEVQEGGSLFRYYRVLDGTTGQPLMNRHGTFAVRQLPGGMSATRDFMTDDKGVIRHDPIDSDDDPRGLKITAASLGAPSADPFEVMVDSVDGVTSAQVCPQAFQVLVKKREYTRTLAGGSSLNAEGSIAAVSIGGMKGFGFSLAEEGDSAGPKALKVGRSINSTAKIGIKATPLKQKLQFIGEATLVKAGAQAGVSQTIMLQDQHEFSFPLTNDECNAVVNLASGGVFASSVSLIPLAGPALSLVISQFEEFGLGLGQSRTSFGGSLGLEVGVGAALEGPTISFKRTGIPLVERLGLGVGTDGSAKIAAIVGVNVSRSLADVLQGDSAFKHWSPSIQYKASADLSRGFSLGLTRQADEEFEAGGETVTEKVTKTTETLKAKLSGGIAANIKFSASVDVTDDPVPKISELAFSVAQPLTWGFDAGLTPIGSLGVPGATSSFSFKITDESKFLKAIGQMVLVQALMGAQVPLIGPSLLGEQMVRLVRLADESSEEIEKGIGLKFPLGLGSVLAGTGAEGGIELSLDSSVSHGVLKHAVKLGETFRLEQYDKDDQIVPSVLDGALPTRLSDCYPLAKALIRAAYQSQTAPIALGVAAARTVISQFFSPSGVELSIDGAAEPDVLQPFTVDLLAFQYRPVAGPVQATVQDPADISGPADRPHYGIGGFFRFVPEEPTRSLDLAAPAQLTIRWLDPEVASVDETTLAIYAWNDQRQDWDLVGGTVDTADNSITTNVNRLGFYTVAPPMPAGNIALTRQSSAGGSLQNPTTIVTYTGTPVRRNVGDIVADGTAFTVRTLQTGTSDFIPFGVVTSPDEDPLTAGIQVRSQGGVIHFTAEYPGDVGAALVVVNSVDGTALADEEIAYP